MNREVFTRLLSNYIFLDLYCIQNYGQDARVTPKTHRCCTSANYLNVSPCFIINNVNILSGENFILLIVGYGMPVIHIIPILHRDINRLVVFMQHWGIEKLLHSYIQIIFSLIYIVYKTTGRMPVLHQKPIAAALPLII